MQTVDVGALLDRAGWSTYQRLLVALTALTIVLDGFDNQLIGVAILPLSAEWNAPRAAFAPVLATRIAGQS